MKLKNIGLQFFAGGDPAPTPTPAPAPEPSPEKTFTQAELDSIVGKRIAKAMKGMPGEEELSDFRAWKESKQSEKEKWDNMVKDRDETKAALAEAQAKLEQFEREKLLLSKGVPAEDVDYYAFKIGKLVTDTVDFQKAAEIYLKDNPPTGTVQVDLSAPLTNSRPTMTKEEIMKIKDIEARHNAMAEHHELFGI